MGCFMNVLWLVLGGVFTAIEYMVSSLLLMVTIVGIPFGMQTLKLPYAPASGQADACIS